MIIDKFSNDDIEKYKKLLEMMASLSNLFSESTIPFIHYRVIENLFCKVFNADNLSRCDGAYDAKIGSTGIGLKTFIYTGIKSEKVAEFNSVSNELRQLDGFDLACRIAELRNKRIQFANDTFGITNSIYHCVARLNKKLSIFESSYDFIQDINEQEIIKSNAGIKFSDGINSYSYNYSKSTLFKKFEISDNHIDLDISIIKDPYEYLLEIFSHKFDALENDVEIAGIDYIILPLYSTKNKNEKIVPERSGLNQWNAGGRKRDIGEVYIPVPSDIKKHATDFFPEKDISFILETPDGLKYSAKLCQENSKALMTNPNKALADWILRKILKLKEGELLTYDKLKQLDIDSVKISKINNQNFKISFSKLDSYETFLSQFTKDK